MVPASITEMEDMIQVMVDVKVRDWVTARDMVMTVEIDESSVRRLMLYHYVGRTQVGRREMAPMIPELDSAIGSGLAILLADELLSQEAEVDCSIDFVDKNRQLVERYGWTDAASVYAAYSEGRDYNRYALRLFLDDCSRREGPDNRYTRHYVEKALARDSDALDVLGCIDKYDEQGEPNPFYAEDCCQNQTPQFLLEMLFAFQCNDEPLIDNLHQFFLHGVGIEPDARMVSILEDCQRRMAEVEEYIDCRDETGLKMLLASPEDDCNHFLDIVESWCGDARLDYLGVLVVSRLYGCRIDNACRKRVVRFVTRYASGVGPMPWVRSPVWLRTATLMRLRLRLPVYSPRRHRRRPLMTTARCSADIFIATTISRPVSRTARRLPVWTARAKTTRCLSLRKRTNSPSVTTAIAVTSGSAVWLAVAAGWARG